MTLKMILGRVFLWRFISRYGISIEKCDISYLISGYGIHISYLDMRYDKSRFGDFENVPQDLFRYAIGTFRNHKTSNSLYLISRYGICIPYRDMRFEISHFSIEIPYPDLKRDRKTRP